MPNGSDVSEPLVAASGYFWPGLMAFVAAASLGATALCVLLIAFVRHYLGDPDVLWVAWVFIGWGLCFGTLVVLVVMVDVTLLSAKQDTLSQRCVDAAYVNPWVAALCSGVLALVIGMLLGHLFLGQTPRTAVYLDPPQAAPVPAREEILLTSIAKRS